MAPSNRTMVCFALLGGLPAGASLAGERAAPGWVHIGAKRRMCCAPAQLRSAKSARSLQRGFMQIVGVSNSESAVPFNLEQDFIEARVESGTRAKPSFTRFRHFIVQNLLGYEGLQPAKLPHHSHPVTLARLGGLVRLPESLFSAV